MRASLSGDPVSGGPLGRTDATQGQELAAGGSGAGASPSHPSTHIVSDHRQLASPPGRSAHLVESEHVAGQGALTSPEIRPCPEPTNPRAAMEPFTFDPCCCNFR